MALGKKKDMNPWKKGSRALSYKIDRMSETCSLRELGVRIA
jgi:hypothetical protein